MGIDLLLAIWVVTWVFKTAATDIAHAVKGTPNPRYELKRERALKAGQPVKGQPRYGTKDYAADFMADFLKAKTEKRRTLQKAKAQPVDDMIGILREPKAKPERVYDPNNSRECPDCKGEVVLDGRPCPRCLAEQQRRNALWDEQAIAVQKARHETPEPPVREEKPVRRDAEDAAEKWTCLGCDMERDPAGRKVEPGRGLICLYCQEFHAVQKIDTTGLEDKQPADTRPDGWAIDPDSPTGRHLAGRWCGDPNCDCACKQCLARMTKPGRSLCDECLTKPDTRPDAQIIQFPNPKNIEKEIIMADSEITSLSHAIAYADTIANTHQNFATAGAEGYVGALERAGNGPAVIASAREAMEASGIAADRWVQHRAVLEQQMTVKEAYQAQPDAADKEFLLNG